jgi:hypothetical protein
VLEQIFEAALWNSRLVVLVAAIALPGLARYLSQMADKGEGH